MPPENDDDPGREAPWEELLETPARELAAVPPPGPPACPVAAARDGEVQVRALDVGAASEELAPRTEPWPGSAAGGFRYAGVVEATVSAVLLDEELVEAVVAPAPVENGYQAIERFPVDEEELDVEELDVRGVGVGPIGFESSGMVIGVSGFRRRIGSPLWGTSSVSSVPCASFTRLARLWFQVAAPVGLRQLKP